MTDNRLEAGAVWNGPWHQGLVHGHFGTAAKRHWAMTSGTYGWVGYRLMNTELAFFPFTSLESNRYLLKFQAGHLPFGNACVSYLLPIRLIVNKKDLMARFSYKTTLPKSIYSNAVRNYIQILKRRKKNA